MTDAGASPKTTRMPAADALVPYRDAREILLGLVALTAPREVPLADALGKPLAEAIVAAAPVPAHPVAGRGGIAVVSRQLVGASPYSPVLLPSAPPCVRPGDALPPPADAVIAEQAVLAAEGLYEIGQGAYPGEGALLAGADLPCGTPIAGAGETVTHALLLALSLSGVVSVAIRSPTITLLDIDAAAPAAMGWLRSALSQAGATPRTSGESDLTVMVVRDPDTVAATLGRREIGAVALNPGRETQLYNRDGRAILVLSPRFDAIVSAFHALLSPAIARMTGRILRQVERPLTRKLVSQVGFADLALMRDTMAGFLPLATGHVPLAALVAADAIGLVEPQSEGAPAGAAFSAIPLQMPYETP